MVYVSSKENILKGRMNIHRPLVWIDREENWNEK
jgi:hypothetical protein